MNHGLLVQLIVSGMLYGTPLIIAALGELLTERSGVLNLGVEGIMLIGAVCGFWISQRVGGSSTVALTFAIVGAAGAGGLMSLIHAFVTITLRGNQIVSGLALTIFGGAVGLSSYFGQIGNLSGHAGHNAFQPINVLGLKNLPLVGPVLFDQNLLVYGSWLLAIAIALYLYRTRLGLRVRAVGEEPKAADAMGINVPRYRYIHTILGGCCAGVGGAVYSLAISPNWTDGMTAGAGWIAIGLVIVAFWRPGLVVAGGYLFGIVTSLGFTLRARGVNLPPELYSALPYLLIIVVLVAVSKVWATGRFGAPKALGAAYERNEA